MERWTLLCLGLSRWGSLFGRSSEGAAEWRGVWDAETAVIHVAELNLADAGGRFCRRSCRVDGLQLEKGCKEGLSLMQ